MPGCVVGENIYVQIFISYCEDRSVSLIYIYHKKYSGYSSESQHVSDSET